MTRETITLGLAANDKKGDSAIVFGAKCEDAFKELYLFLSGNSSTVTLPSSGIPISKGGTGGETVQEARDNLGLLTDTNNSFVLGGSGTKLYDDRLVNYAQAIRPFSMTKEGINTYVIKTATSHGLNGFKYVLPRDELGNLLCTCTIEFNTVSSTAVVKVYGVLFSNGRYAPDLNAPMSIPEGRCIDISLR
ncbi:MAG: hypothetical protein RR575_00285 [Acinetobacter sp.]